MAEYRRGAKRRRPRSAEQRDAYAYTHFGQRPGDARYTSPSGMAAPPRTTTYFRAMAAESKTPPVPRSASQKTNDLGFTPSQNLAARAAYNRTNPPTRKVRTKYPVVQSYYPGGFGENNFVMQSNAKLTSGHTLAPKSGSHHGTVPAQHAYTPPAPPKRIRGHSQKSLPPLPRMKAIKKAPPKKKAAPRGQVNRRYE